MNSEPDECGPSLASEEVAGAGHSAKTDKPERTQSSLIADGANPQCSDQLRNPPDGATEEPPNSIRAARGSKPARIDWTPLRLGDLRPAPPVPWLMRLVLARGHTTLLTGLWKSGKSTLIASVLADIGRGCGLSAETVPHEAIIVSEESQDHWRRRRDQLKLLDETRIVCRPFRLRPRMHEWVAFIDSLICSVESLKSSLVVFDTIASVWPVNEENDAAEVQAALSPLNRITESGAALLLVHHPSKSEQTQGRASRGSGALPGFVDIIAEFRRKSSETNCRQRVLELYSRLEGGDSKLLLELQESAYVNLGGYEQVAGAERRTRIVESLPTDGNGLTAEEVRVRCKAPGGLGLRSCQAELDSAWRSGGIQRTGSGRKGSPFRYLRTPNATRANDSA